MLHGTIYTYMDSLNAFSANISPVLARCVGHIQPKIRNVKAKGKTTTGKYLLMKRFERTDKREAFVGSI